MYNLPPDVAPAGHSISAMGQADLYEHLGPMDGAAAAAPPGMYDMLSPRPTTSDSSPRPRTGSSSGGPPGRHSSLSGARNAWQ